MRGRNTIRSDTTEGCCFMLLFMHPQQLLSIPFPRAGPRFATQLPRQSFRLQHSPRHSHAPCLKIENAGIAPLRACRHRLKSMTVGSKYTEPSRNFVVPASVVL
jgi:hypothetical protein